LRRAVALLWLVIALVVSCHPGTRCFGHGILTERGSSTAREGGPNLRLQRPALRRNHLAVDGGATWLGDQPLIQKNPDPAVPTAPCFAALPFFKG